MKSKATHGTGDPKRQNLPDDPEQSKRFEEKAHELGADESGKKFEKVFGSVVPTTPEVAPVRPSGKRPSS